MSILPSHGIGAALLGLSLGLATSGATQAAVFEINALTASANNRQAFDPSQDVWRLDLSAFPVTGPLVFASGGTANPGFADPALNNPLTFGANANVIILRNFDNNDSNGFPANWDNSFNARRALEAIAANTDGNRAGFFVYWNEKLGVNRLVYTSNLNDGGATLSVLFAINSLNLLANADDLALTTTLRGEANANFNALANFSAANFSTVPVPAAMPLLGSALASFGLVRRRRS